MKNAPLLIRIVFGQDFASVFPVLDEFPGRIRDPLNRGLLFGHGLNVRLKLISLGFQFLKLGPHASDPELTERLQHFDQIFDLGLDTRQSMASDVDQPEPQQGYSLIQNFTRGPVTAVVVLLLGGSL
ncbi:hypothetical protein C5Y96_25765 [Blastopirellula marina]|uniref:Uncharacterized protein n=1 Tax=Blastopirellula marina TaxID=124 RepID=A0A2S8EZF9_9BACT|nr:hypothetical protein C5Y96_25765 [Blastopirellula marina]RCS41743.1 hypothetical protein DTL36_25815 [Bremerella cremea]